MAMKRLLCILIILSLFACNSDNRNEVLVLGLIHGSHLTEEEFSTEILRNMVIEIDPDIILTEIPPDRFEKAMTTYAETGVVNESRVARFPEYIDVIIPLTKEMDFELIPTAAWTEEMADARLEKMRSVRDNPDRYDDWQAYGRARFKSDSIKKASGREFDPFWINSDAYDEAAEVALSVYNKLFNEELGAGGWDNINKAHYANIAKALDENANQGKRILITYGAGHKGWFLRELRKREDIRLIGLEEALSMDNR